MKKTYINPTIDIVKIATQQMLAGSQTLVNKGNFGTGDGITLGGRDDDGDDW